MLTCFAGAIHCAEAVESAEVNIPCTPTLVSVFSKAMLGSDLEARYKMMSMLVKSANGQFEGTGISEAMILVLQEPKVDLRLLEALVKEGLADVNFNQSAPIILGM